MGYYYLQGSVQTGVYTTVFVHNDFPAASYGLRVDSRDCRCCSILSKPVLREAGPYAKAVLQ